MNEGRDTSHLPSAAEVRAWGMERNPRALSAKGQLPLALVKAWNKAHPDRQFVKAEGFHGTPQGYMSRDCRCNRCLEAGRRYERERRRTIAEDKWADA